MTSKTEGGINSELLMSMLNAVMTAPKPAYDTIIVDPFYYDTLKAEQSVMDNFQGRDWRRIKRERRKAHDAVKAKHRAHKAMKGAAYFVDSSQMFWRSSAQIKVGEW